MITALHLLVHSDDPTATRAYFRDVLRWPFVAEDEATNDPSEWLIFNTGPSELGVHPTSGEHLGEPYTLPKHHAIAVMCEDLEGTIDDLASRGASFNGGVDDMGWGRGILLQVPGADDMLLYEARHRTAHSG